MACHQAHATEQAAWHPERAPFMIDDANRIVIV